jgi:exportin-7
VLKNSPGGKLETTKIFYVLRGILRGLNNSKVFNLFFEWFYPAYFAMSIEGALNAFYDDDEVVCVALSRNNRLRFDTWSINGLIVFKETAKYVIQLL